MNRQDREVKRNWQLLELHGLWWAYQGELPRQEAFRTHSRPLHPPILGPYPSRATAEALLRRHGFLAEAGLGGRA
jgi:hypothetical protein